ncbi:MAG: hypothetical protein ACOX19_03000 [Fermentimonas sp.]
MKRSNIFILLILLYSFCLFDSYGQTNNIQGTSKSEIDRLSDIYKDTKSITLSTPHGKLEGSVFVNTNDVNKPESVFIAGVSTNKPAIVAHLTNTINMKMKQGYKPIRDYTTGYGSYSDLFELQMMLLNLENNRSYEMAFTKGQMSFRAGVALNVNLVERNSEYGINPYDKVVDGFLWYIETKDSKRVVGSKGSEFIF